MIVVQEFSPNQFRPWTGQPLGVDEITAPPIVSVVWTDEELAAFGLFRAVPFDPPSGYVATGEPSYARVGEQIVETYATEPEPPPSAEEVRVSGYAADAGVQTVLNMLRNANVSDVDPWLATNVTNLAEARAVLGYVIKLLVLFLKRRV